ncbi:nicotinamide riboside transporter PnuC [Coraliomargarita sp. SDUM461004]|uniref:Nicotinamide riboside transporter PnuC n=1 Tax=Thalassobacterium sedimentorum TaxID=3041258 RepID=A0ABU1AI29_9BACT|nr:nicotinamide riboside transporter PnuC [Coraliomargarita sp. SDUM461004]MDQ8194471.1 nicotinamide riboside transporter PnuC [Coraliomargarita sp. SDUM461004]
MDEFWSQLSTISPIDWFAMLTGIAGVYLSIKEKTLAWLLFILCYIAYVYISFRESYFAFGGMNVIFVAVASYGWYQWTKSTQDNTADEVRISHLPANRRWLVATFICIGTIGIGWTLAQTGEARLPYYDAFATSCALVAQWMLSRKHIENWIFWILSDLVYLVFFFNDRIWPSVILFAVFTLLAVKGWLTWKPKLTTSIIQPDSQK